MAKNTHAQEAATGTSGSIEPEVIEMEPHMPESIRHILQNRPVIGGPPPKETSDMEAGEGRYLGSNFSASNENPVNSTDSQASPNRAPATENLSSPGAVVPEEQLSGADSAGGTPRMEGQSDDDGEVSDDYDSLTVPQLQEILIRRDLPHSGKKAELIERLREDDASDEDDEFDEEEEEESDDSDSFI